MTHKPTPAELQSARDKLIPDVLAPNLRVVFCGINPGLYSGAVGHHFARPGNRFWSTLHASGFTPRQFKPAEQFELLSLGLGLTNIVARTTARADELSVSELIAGMKNLEIKIARYRPAVLAVLGISASNRVGPTACGVRSTNRSVARHSRLDFAQSQRLECALHTRQISRAI